MKKHLPKALFALLLGSNVVHADIEHTTRFTASEINTSPGAANTAKSLAAAARMGHLAWLGTTPPDESSLIVGCAARTGTSAWPGSCNPGGMVAALIANGSGSWTRDDFAATDANAAISAQVSHLTGPLRTPNVLPLYGHADHWGINHKIWTDDFGVVVEFDFFDGGPQGERDGTRTGYTNGETFSDPTTWKSIYFKVITTVPESDPFFNRYVNLWEPPPGYVEPVTSAQVRRSPGVVATGTKVTPVIARDLALASLQAAGLTRHQQKWPVLAAATPLMPLEVSGVYPDGASWDYFVVPFVNRANLVVALALLEKDTLRFQMATVLSQPMPLYKYAGSQFQQAAEAARNALRPGETLGQGLLTWDPAATAQHASSPLAPYYEFTVFSAGKPVGSQIVRSDDGSVSTLSTEQMSRRLPR